VTACRASIRWDRASRQATTACSSPTGCRTMRARRVVNVLLEDRQGRLWCGTDDGLYWFEDETERRLSPCRLAGSGRGFEHGDPAPQRRPAWHFVCSASRPTAESNDSPIRRTCPTAPSAPHSWTWMRKTGPIARDHDRAKALDHVIFARRSGFSMPSRSSVRAHPRGASAESRPESLSYRGRRRCQQLCHGGRLCSHLVKRFSL
jgi:hypothetical protein